MRFFLVILLSLLSSVALANSEVIDNAPTNINTDLNDIGNNHVYIDLNLGVMNPIGNGSGYSMGSNIDVGYMFNNYWGVEGGIIGAGNYGAASTQQYNYGALDFAAKGVLPVADRFALYGKLGLAVGSFSSNNYYANNSGGVSINQQSNNSLGTLVGAGIQFNVNRQFSLHLEDDYIVQFNPPAGYFDPNFMMIGCEFRF